jgi:hypothetical protein
MCHFRSRDLLSRRLSPGSRRGKGQGQQPLEHIVLNYRDGIGPFMEEAFSAVQPGIGRYLPRRTSVLGLGPPNHWYFVFSVVLLPMNGFTFGLWSVAMTLFITLDLLDRNSDAHASPPRCISGLVNLHPVLGWWNG